MQFKKYIWALISLFYSYHLFAFINIESQRENSKQGINTAGKIQFNQQTGNTDKILYSGSLFNSYKTENQEYMAIGNIRYGESFDRKDTEDGNIHLRYTQKISGNHYAEMYTQYEYNNFKALTARRLYGLGYRFDTNFVKLGIGAFDENEVVNPGEDQTAVRGNFYLSNSYKNKTGFEFAAIFYLQPSFRYGDDLRTTLNAGISQKINSTISMLIEYQNVYDQRPPTDIKNYDSSLLFGLSFN